MDTESPTKHSHNGLVKLEVSKQIFRNQHDISHPLSHLKDILNIFIQYDSTDDDVEYVQTNDVSVIKSRYEVENGLNRPNGFHGSLQNGLYPNQNESPKRPRHNSGQEIAEDDEPTFKLTQNGCLGSLMSTRIL